MARLGWEEDREKRGLNVEVRSDTLGNRVKRGQDDSLGRDKARG